MSIILEALKRAQESISEIRLDTLLEGQTEEIAGKDIAAKEAARPKAPPKAAPTPPAVISAASPAGRVARLRVRPDSPILPFDGTHWRAGEQYRILRTRIVQHPTAPRMVVVTSTCPSDGKSVTVINLAGALALKSDARVAVLDADFRRSTVSRQLGLPLAPGLSDVLKGDCTLEEAAIQTEQIPNLYIVPAGSASTNPVELLDSPGWTALCAACRSRFEYIVVDSPPLGAVADYDLIQAVCDGVVMVVRPDHTDRQLCFKALKAVPAEKLLGIVMNCASGWLVDREKKFGAYYNYAATTT